MNRSLKTTLLVLCACLMPAEVRAQSNGYNWLAGQLAPTPEIRKRIVDAIDAQVASTSSTKATRTPPADPQKDPITLGPVVLDVNDMTGKQLTWRGFAAGTIARKAGERGTQRPRGPQRIEST